MKDATKKTLLYAVGIGAGSVLAVALLFGGWLWYSQRPKPWNSKAITARFELAYKVPNVDYDAPVKAGIASVPAQPHDWFAENAPDETGFDLWYFVTNHTAADYELSPTDVTVNAVLKNSRVLTFSKSAKNEPQVQFPADRNNLSQPIYIPTGKTARVIVHLPGYASLKDNAILMVSKGEIYSQASPRVVSYLEKQAPNLGGFVIFDRVHRYEIDFPWNPSISSSQ